MPRPPVLLAIAPLPAADPARGAPFASPNPGQCQRTR